MSLRSRLLLALLTVVALGMIVAGAATWLSLRSFLLERIDQQLRAARIPVTMALATGINRDQLPFGPGGPGDASLPPGTWGQLQTSSGTVINTMSFAYGQSDLPAPRLPDPLPGTTSAQSGASGASGTASGGTNGTTSGGADAGSSGAAAPGLPGPLSGADLSGRGSTVFTTGSTDGQPHAFRILVQSVPRLDRVLVVAIPLKETQGTLDRLLVVEVLVSLAVLAALAAATWWIVKHDLRPLEAMADTAGVIAAGDYTQRVEPAEPRTEVGRLGLSLNAMLGQIEEAFAERTASEERLRRFLADASHELRTPLTSIRGYAEVFERGAKDDPEDLATAMRRIEEESRRMGGIVDDLLLLARLDEQRAPRREPFDLAAVVADAVGDARTAAPERTVELDSPAVLTVTGDGDQLRQVIANLLGNAVRHTPPEAAVRVRLLDGGTEAILDVEDDGPGLDPEAAARVFEPFYRADDSRTRKTGGSGLGLAIAAGIVKAHGGDLTLSTAPGAGATFTVRLPMDADAGV